MMKKKDPRRKFFKKNKLIGWSLLQYFLLGLYIKIKQGCIKYGFVASEKNDGNARRINY